MAPSPPPRPRVNAPPANSRTHKARTIEDQIRYGYYTPAPGAYDPNDPRKPENTDPKPLGKISESRHPSCLDHQSKTKAFVPGPGSYSTPDLGPMPLPEGGRLNRNAPQERLKIDECPKPPPGAYGIPDDPSKPRLVNGKFSKDPRVTAFIANEVNRTKANPGPGGHDVLESMEAMKPFCPEGGRSMQGGKPPGYFEVAPTLSEGKPGPDRYDLTNQGAIQPHRTTGRLVYRYESATIGETRDLIARVVGDTNAGPGPGHYDTPDCPPMTHAPVLKGKGLSHGMPHPFAYNCAPDYARNFGNLAPVRKANNAEQIFGNGVKNGVIQRRKNGSSSPSNVDKVAAHELPKGLESIEEEYHDVVQWRSGGFTKMPKSRSAGALLRAEPEHPSVADARRSYTSLSKQNRKTHAFLPLASRRSESVSTHDNSEEYGRLRRGKWHLKNMADSLDTLTASVFEPLDEEKLKQDAMAGLRMKALERMKFEGVSQRQQELMVAEMNQVMEEQVKKRSAMGMEQSVVEQAAGSLNDFQVGDGHQAVGVV